MLHSSFSSDAFIPSASDSRAPVNNLTTSLSDMSTSFPSITPAFSKSATISSSITSIRENVQVIVRCRPKSKAEEEGADAPPCWSIKPDVGSIELVKPKLSNSSHLFHFDQVYMGVDNDQVYNAGISHLVKSSMMGYNGTVFAYGQTASGKTYTMVSNDQQPGIIPRAINDVFTYIEEDTSGREYLLRVSYLEIYNEKIKDLLNIDNQDISIVEGKKGVHVRNLTEVKVKSPKEVFDIINQGEANRHISATDYNQRSSRSHTVFQVVIESRHIGVSNGVQISQLNLIDLAGSEKVASDVERRKEGAYINKSLLTLGTVIHKLTTAKTAQHIPFRNSKLTRILQGALSGNARISVICTINPTYASKDESLNTLKFAQRTKLMQTAARVTNIHDNSELENCLIKIAELQTKVKEKDDSEAETRERLKNLLSLILKSSKTTAEDGEDAVSSRDTALGINNASNLNLMDDDILNASTIHEVVGRCEETLAAQLDVHNIEVQRMRTEQHQLQAKIKMLEALQAQHLETLAKRDHQIDKLNKELFDAKQAITNASKKIINLSKKITYNDRGVQCDSLKEKCTIATAKTMDTGVQSCSSDHLKEGRKAKQAVKDSNTDTKFIDANIQTDVISIKSDMDEDSKGTSESWCLESVSFSPCNNSHVQDFDSTDEWIETVSELAVLPSRVDTPKDDILSTSSSLAETVNMKVANLQTRTNEQPSNEMSMNASSASMNANDTSAKKDFADYVPYSGSIRQQVPFIIFTNPFAVILMLAYFFW
ncbi:P-loop containing nucleoside triphosphate hydrolase protein [Mycotypha africana]|uniref:P-loop containing nucleoside triphosphate hydrolase protein n=1 Tax=Mycotypha africana TaxID=64632 RepID=UPI0023016248|nr:P-loop containing nucleoside triphosphate hydrolase protein [Mycotypha africana]KAI8977343.1 P-loop containing nucleoside triphosphate hydrolase protein [Mycotypha africana]